MAHLSRRKLLKSTAVIGSAVLASTFLPEQWLKPAVKSGVIPVHAQSSCLYQFDVHEWATEYSFVKIGTVCASEIPAALSQITYQNKQYQFIFAYMITEVMPHGDGYYPLK